MSYGQPYRLQMIKEIDLSGRSMLVGVHDNVVIFLTHKNHGCVGARAKPPKVCIVPRQVSVWNAEKSHFSLGFPIEESCGGLIVCPGGPDVLPRQSYQSVHPRHLHAGAAHRLRGGSPCRNQYQTHRLE